MATGKRLIDANELKDKFLYLRKMWSETEIVLTIDDAKTVDAVEVVHGRWNAELMPTGVECSGYAEMTVQALSCSVCGKCVDVSEAYFSYCPNCGAKMDGDGNA